MLSVRRWHVLSLLLLLAMGASPRHSAAAIQPEDPPTREPFLNSNPLGFGAIASTNSIGNSAAFVLEGSNHFRQRVGFYGIRQYGFAESRAELGPSPGLSLSAATGITLLGMEEHDRLAFHLGVEPFNGRVSWRATDSGRSFYQWFPTASVGAQFSGGPCRALGLLRAGGGLGNFASAGMRPETKPVAGSALHLNCRRADVGFEILNLGKGGEAAVFRTFDLTWNLPRSSWKMGARAEWINAQSNPLDERRWLLVMRTNPLE
jgi:hypothetical protein